MPICRELNSAKRRTLLNEVWSLVELSQPQSQYKLELARAETEHEHHIAEIHTLLAELDDLPGDASEDA